jgi:hypothetical protein
LDVRDAQGRRRGKKRTSPQQKNIRQKYHLITIPHQEFDIAESSHLCQRVPEGAPDVAVH